ncbi:hypothetical protein ACFYRJ_17555 [Streptomyces sp. NPDC005531]|uniref:hypothetical protein n=1 Tax=Streptomyces sp. NPDC005531 TaxID=3364722 RepID=UPI00367BF66D
MTDQPTTPAAELKAAAFQIRNPFHLPGLKVGIDVELGFALADWLDERAECLDRTTHPGWQSTVEPHALAVARQILGTTEASTAEHHVVDGARYLCHADDHYCPDEAQQPTPAEVPLTAAERQFLTFALDQAADEMSLGDGFTDEDRAALDRFRRMAEQPAPAVTEGRTL